MSSRQVPNGFTPRQEAITKFGRSKSSFIRDFDEAQKAGDMGFLKRFRVLLKDGTQIDGPDATKEKLQEVASLKPWWLIETQLLETRYWDKGKNSDDSVSSKKKDRTDADEAGASSQASTLEGADTVTQLRHQLALEKKENDWHRREIATLKETNEFLKDELTHRRKDMQELTELIDTMRKALLQAGDSKSTPERPPANDRSNVIEVVASKQGTKPSQPKPKQSPKKKTTSDTKRRSRPKKQTWAEKHLPTFSRFIS